MVSLLVLVATYRIIKQPFMYLVFYLTIIILYLFLSRFGDNDKIRRTYIYIVSVLLCFCTAFRHLAVGNDTYAYYLHFKKISKQDISTLIDNIINSFGQVSTNFNKDPGYNVFVKIADTFCLGSFELYQLMIAVFFISAIGYLIYNYVKYFSGYIISYGFYISLFYHYLPNSATRQTIAFAVFLWAVILWIDKGKKTLPICMILVGSLMHKSVLIGFLPIVLMFRKEKDNFIKYAIIGFVVMFLFGRMITTYLADIANSSNYADYAASNYYARNEGKPYGFIIQIFLLFFIGIYNIDKIEEHSPMEQFAIINFYLAVVFAPIILVDPSLIRLNAYFSLWGIVFIPNIILQYPEQTRMRQMVLLLVLCLVLGRPLLTGIRDDNYKFNWEKKELHDRYRH